MDFAQVQITQAQVDLVAILEASWARMRVQFGANELLNAIDELEAILAHQAE